MDKQTAERIANPYALEEIAKNLEGIYGHLYLMAGILNDKK